MTLTDSTPEEIDAVRQALAKTLPDFERVCGEKPNQYRDMQRRSWLAREVWWHAPELDTKKCLALVDELLPTLTEKTTACLALLVVAGNVGGWTIVLGGWL
jgi:hypothetical protein